MTHRIFLYGTLCDPQLFEAVAGVPLTAQAATLPDHVTLWARDESFPLVVRREHEPLCDGKVTDAGESIAKAIIGDKKEWMILPPRLSPSRCASEDKTWVVVPPLPRSLHQLIDDNRQRGVDEWFDQHSYRLRFINSLT